MGNTEGYRAVHATSAAGTGSAEADIGLIGLAVMGENLVLNMASKGFTVAVFNRTAAKVDSFIQGRGAGKKIQGYQDTASFARALKPPRKAMIMVKAGEAVDDTIEQLLKVFEKGDIIIDGGNSNYQDTIRRTAYVESQGLWYIGTGVSGGEEGALTGPSLMPGGSSAAWPLVKPILQAIAAKVEGDIPCCDWVGENGAGHFVKMVHNGIEYGDMQLICEIYQVLKQVLGLSYDAMGDVFDTWNKGDLNSYLIGITRDILRFKDTDGEPLAEKILDTAGQKGTGKWTGIAALEFGVPLTLIGEAVWSRCLSAARNERVRSSKIFFGPKLAKPADPEAFIQDLEKALYAAKVVSYAQGYLLMREAAKEYKWNLNYGGIALMWRGGCIIRSVFLGKIKEAFDKHPDLENLLLDPFFTSIIEEAQASWRRVVIAAVENGIPVPALSSALAYFDGYRSDWLPANLLQAQRDYFGAHTYERVDKPRGEFFHTNWTGHGAVTSASTYTV
ncbi:MAG: decarboxylating NADP(+)-dependent phosphogluconate dehydrogenase [Treponema sp.]|jgi:6-phosphogluconate dehydrogenase|nr:decarboxylating NADP(+)-dependent phosphogluconate dehydrogenase [Treponema sp.]